MSHSEIKLVGVLFRSPQMRPTVYLDEPSAQALRSWREEQGIFTKWKDGLNPSSGTRTPILYPSETLVGSLSDGTQANITLGLRRDRRGPGITVLDVRPMAGS